MAQKKPSVAAQPEKIAPKARTRPITDRGVYDAQQFAAAMSALMSDVVSGALAPDVVNAACNTGGKLLKVVEMQYKYGKLGADGGRTLTLVNGTVPRHV